MKFEEVLPALKDKKKVIRKGRAVLFFGANTRKEISLRSSSRGSASYCWGSKITIEDLLAEDWEIINE
jgi:hypothetical protein